MKLRASETAEKQKNERISRPRGRFAVKKRWEIIQTPVGISPDAKLCTDAEESLRVEHPELKRYLAVIRARGNGAARSRSKRHSLGYGP